MRGLRRAAILAAGVLASPAVVRAQITEEPPEVFPDPAKFAHGFFAEGGAGTVLLVGKTGGKLSPGVAVNARFGYDLNRWLAVQAFASGSTHQGVFPGTPQDDELLQIYAGGFELRLTRTFRQVSIFAFGGGGWSRQSTNLLAVAGLTVKRNSWIAGGGLGLDYHTLSRHFSIGLSVGYLHFPALEASGLVPAGAYLRYTF